MLHKEGALVGALFKFCLFFRDLRFNLLDHLGEFDFALLFCFVIDIEFFSLTTWQSWEEATFPQVVVYLIQASGAGFAYPPRDGLRMGLCGRTRGVYGRVCAFRGWFALPRASVRLCRRFCVQCSPPPASASCRSCGCRYQA